MAEFLLGMNAAIYYDDDPATAPTSSGGMTIIDNVKDVTLSLTKGEADVTTRGNDGWRATAGTLKECEVTFQMQWKPGDEAFEAVRDAFLGDEKVIGLAVLDQPGGEGIVGSFSVINFTRNEPLEDAITVDVTAKLSAFGAWETGTGSGGGSSGGGSSGG